MKRTAAVFALALLGLAGFGGAALAGKDKGGDPGPPSDPPGHSGSAPGQLKKEQAAPAQSSQAADEDNSAKPDKHKQGKKAKPEHAQGPSSHAQAGKITICHRTGSTKNPWVRITVSANAWKGHEKHGDLNPAPAAGCPGGSPSGGPGGGGGGDHAKITICHRTGSEKNPWVEITVSENAWKAHEQHGDLNPVPAGGCPAAHQGTTTTTTQQQSTAPSTTTKTTPSGASTTAGTTTTATVVAAAPSQSAPVQPVSSPSRPKQGAPVSGQEGASPGSTTPKKVSSKGVLEQARDLGSEVQRQELPFTGLPLWPVVLGAGGLVGAGLAARRHGRRVGSG